MNELAIRQENALIFSGSTKVLFRARVSENPLNAYQWALDRLGVWLDSELSDVVAPLQNTH